MLGPEGTKGHGVDTCAPELIDLVYTLSLQSQLSWNISFQTGLRNILYV